MTRAGERVSVLGIERNRVLSRAGVFLHASTLATTERSVLKILFQRSEMIRHVLFPGAAITPVLPLALFTEHSLQSALL